MGMTLAIAILCDQNLGRVADLVGAISGKGVKIAIHVDQKCDPAEMQQLRRRIAGQPDVIFAKRIACEWGRYSLVEAELQLVQEILDRWPSVEHVQLLSGDSLPVRPLSVLVDMLARNGDTDYIESVAVSGNNWIAGGLGIERFTLRFPFSWKRQRRLFDFWVAVQRRLGLFRPLPPGLSVYIGSQWWCLSRETLRAILDDPDKPALDAFFRAAWIPDESYFQTLVRKHARRIESSSLVYSRFDHQGKPVKFYDDHVELLSGLDAYFARKIWCGADHLYRNIGTDILNEEPRETGSSLQAHIDKATTRRRVGRAGLRMIGRVPNRWKEPHTATAGDYSIYCGMEPLFEGLQEWLARHSNAEVYGRLYAPDRVRFGKNIQVGPGGLSNDAAIRDNAPECFLRNVLWQNRGRTLAFGYELMDLTRIEKVFAKDVHASLHLVEYGWLGALMRRDITNPDVLRVAAARLGARERKFINRLSDAERRCTFQIITLGEALGNPLAALSPLVESLTGKPLVLPVVLPKIADANALLQFARHLKNIGVDIDLAKIDGRASQGARLFAALAAK